MHLFLGYNMDMAKYRVLIFLSTILIVSFFGFLSISYARGYRFNFKNLTLAPTGLLVVKSEPTGAQIFVNGDLKTASDTTLSLAPGTYDVEVRKEGYLSWYKRLTIAKEEVTEATVSLFKQAPSLTPVTFSGAVSPIPSEDLSRIAYIVLPDKLATTDNEGLWLIETSELPIVGFSKDPRRITNGDLTGASIIFSPDSREILLTTKTGVFLLNLSQYTPQASRVNIASQKESILQGWEDLKKIKLEAKIRNLPPELIDVLQRKVSRVVFSPDDNKILYTASDSATLQDNLIKQLPGSSTQKQARNIEKGKTYVYDIKEDRNFVVADEGKNPNWFPTSRHLVLSEDAKVTVMDYDGTNKISAYSGRYIAPHAYPYFNTTKLLILTDLGAVDGPANLYSLTLK
jgi:WD40 repeat protein